MMKMKPIYKNDGTVTITQAEYLRLRKDALVLGGLEMAGVDNWGGYGEHWESLRENAPEEMEELFPDMM